MAMKVIVAVICVQPSTWLFLPLVSRTVRKLSAFFQAAVSLCGPDSHRLPLIAAPSLGALPLPSTLNSGASQLSRLEIWGWIILCCAGETGKVGVRDACHY